MHYGSLGEEMSEAGANAAHWFVDRYRNGKTAEKIAFLEHETGNTISYGQLAGETDKLGALYDRYGVRPEERVALLVLDEIAFPMIFWGSIKAGVVPVCFNTLLSTEIYNYMLRDSRARVLFVSNALFPVIEPIIASVPTLEKVFVIGGDTPRDCLDFASELEKCQPSPVVPVSSDDCAFWLYSSGSTGQPKGVRHSHSALRATADTYGAGVLGTRHEDVIYSAAKLFFAYGLGNGMTFPMAVGATTILLAGRPTPDAVFGILNKHKPSVFCGVPTLYAACVATMEAGSHKVEHDLRRCISAGEALPREVGQRWEKLTGCEILDGVGSTEMLHIFLSNAPGDVEYGTSGIAVPGYALRLVDERGSEVGAGEVGELLVKGNSSAIEYWNLREKSRDTFEGWWTRTGDKYERREDGRLIYCGRTDDMFKVSGIWVSPFEVEQALIEHESVLEAAVVAKRDADGLEKPKAFIVLKDGQSSLDLAEVLKNHVQKRIGKWKYPRWIEFVEELPKTATGKIQRFKLRS